MERKHNARCAASKKPKCRCRCHGERHGAAAKETDDLFGGELDQKTTVLDGEPLFLVLPDSPKTIFLQRDGEGRPQTNVPHRFVWHSPTGFEWGYGGSGPADLALNILALYVDPPTARFLHYDFKWDYIATLPREGCRLSKTEILDWIQAKKSNSDGREKIWEALR
ncbi:MAG: hypothetical protein L0Z48_10650 [candidate division Zixibacteria bacterium]|nr:hypothetical protein [candidate division Zixibacteria bacterium]